METKEKQTTNKPQWLQKQNIKEFIKRAKTLRGDPHYVAMGMAIGVFVSVTPTIPFHTAIAVALAFALKGSKPAAIIGVWFSNPITIPFFYMGSYKVGMLVFDKPISFDVKYKTVQELMKMGWDITAAMIAGGVILGIIPGIAAYFITRKIFIKIRMRKKQKSNPDISCN
jgi:uncharacterized protein (DUF2062 family)